MNYKCLLTPAFHGLTSARRNPPRPGRPSGTRTPARGPRGGPASGGVSGGTTYRLQEAATEEEGRRAVAAEERRAGTRSPLRRGGVAAEERRASRGDVPWRAAVLGTGGRTSARPSSPAAGDGVARVSGRSGAVRR
jgi:hypothetical protein